METILVQMAQEDWTMQAVHLACALARNNGAEVALLRLMPVPHPSYLGTSMGNQPPTEHEYRMLKEYAATAEDYGVSFTVNSMQCMTTLDAVAEAADNLDAKVVFAQVPESRIPYWRTFQIWNLKRQFHGGQRQLFTLDQPVNDPDWTPAITVKAAAPVK
jgi:nucleotide-binding universal stress UspA family protein